MTKDLSYFKSLKYKIIIIFDYEDNCWYGEFSDLKGVLAHGDTPMQALENALKVKDEFFEVSINTGRADYISEPIS